MDCEDSTLGVGADNDENIQLFVSWLLENGAQFPKIDWPSSATVCLLF
jgi:hypothetical protein